MQVEIRCPNPDCGQRYQIDQSRLAREARCERCGWTFITESVGDTLGEEDQPSVPAGPAAAEALPVEPPPICTAGVSAAASPPLPPPVAPSLEGVPQRIGRFAIRRRLGAGAFGAVYQAHDPVLDREVALKVPRAAALASPEAQARFLREPKAAARLRHPHIVAVHDAGSDGQQYYIASEYIRGQTLEEVIDEARPDFDHAAEIIRSLAEALDYAHHLEIVHRDVKPGNIMVDPQGQALLMDFGLARIGHSDEQLTQDGRPLGTPAYMAPEQIDPSFGQPGAASDQYSLGVVLYELLCGERPFNGPSQVVLFNILHHPPESPRSRNPAVPVDLETICLKAMAKRPEDRYADCGELAADLRRWLADEPVQARRMGLVERAVRWCRRNPVVAGLSTTIVLLLIAVAAITTNAYFREAHLRQIAVGDRDVARDAVEKKEAALEEADRHAEIAKDERDAAQRAELEAIGLLLLAIDSQRQMEQERDRAERMTQMARDAVDQYFTKVSQDPRLKAVGLEALRRELLETARRFYEQFIEEYPDDPDLKAELGRAHSRLGTITDHLGEKHSAIELYEGARSIFEQLAQQHPTVLDYQCDLAECHSSLGGVYWAMRDVEKAKEEFDLALGIWTRLAGEEHANSPDYPRYQSGLARVYNSLGIVHWAKREFADAEKAYEDARNIWEKLLAQQDPKDPEYQHELAGTYNNLGVINWAKGKPWSAEFSCEQAKSIWERLTAEHPNVPKYQSGLAGVHNSLYILYRTEMQPEKAEQACQEAIKILDHLAQKHPDVPEYQNDLAKTHTSLGILYETKGQAARAEEEDPEEQIAARRKYQEGAKEEYEEALRINEELVSNYRDVPEYEHCLASTHNRLGLWHMAAGQPMDAQDEFRAALDKYQALCQNHEVPEYAVALGATYHNMANLLRDTKNPEDALDLYDKAIPELKESYDNLPQVTAHGSVPLPDMPQYGRYGTTPFSSGTASSSLLRIDRVIYAFTPTATFTAPSEFILPSASQGRTINPLTWWFLLVADGVLGHLSPQDANKSAPKPPSLPPATVHLPPSLPNPKRPGRKPPFPPKPPPPRGKSPVHASARLALRNVYWDRARAYEMLDRYAEAATDWHQVVKYDSRSNYPGFHLCRELARARAGDHALVQIEANRLVKDLTSGQHLYHAARVYAVAAAAARDDKTLSPEVRDTRVLSYAVSAVGRLRDARAVGYFDDPAHVEAFKNEPDFAALQESPNFRAFLAAVTSSGSF